LSHGIVCFLRDETTRTRWRFAIATKPVVPFNHSESKRLGVKVYTAHTPMNGGAPEVKKLERYFSNYAQGDGWYGPITDEQMSAIATRIRKETAAFLDGEPLP
jgi:hypothetical protein